METKRRHLQRVKSMASTTMINTEQVSAYSQINIKAYLEAYLILFFNTCSFSETKRYLKDKNIEKARSLKKQYSH